MFIIFVLYIMNYFLSYNLQTIFVFILHIFTDEHTPNRKRKKGQLSIKKKKKKRIHKTPTHQEDKNRVIHHVQCLSLKEKYEQVLDKLKINCRANNINYNVLHLMRFDVPTKKTSSTLSFLCAKNMCGQLNRDNCPEGLQCCHKVFSVKESTRICTKAALQNCF